MHELDHAATSAGDRRRTVARIEEEHSCAAKLVTPYILLGLLIAGAFAAWVPVSWLHDVFLADDPTAAAILGPLVGPLLAMVSFVCPIGNIPLAAVLWNGGLSFGGVVSFIFADLIVIPVLLIYRKYYGTRMALFLFATFYPAMAGTGYIIEITFNLLGLIPPTATPR